MSPHVFIPDVFIHETAEVRTTDIGAGTRIWQFSVVLSDVRIGKNCNVNAHCFIENGVRIGDDVTVKSGVYLWTGLVVQDRVFIGPNVTFTNDKYPRSKAYPNEYATTVLCAGSSIGAGATVLCGLTIGRGAMIGAGSVVTKNVPAGELWYGNPARRQSTAPAADRDG